MLYGCLSQTTCVLLAFVHLAHLLIDRGSTMETFSQAATSWKKGLVQHRVVPSLAFLLQLFKTNGRRHGSWAGRQWIRSAAWLCSTHKLVLFQTFSKNIFRCRSLCVFFAFRCESCLQVEASPGGLIFLDVSFCLSSVC